MGETKEPLVKICKVFFSELRILRLKILNLTDFDSFSGLIIVFLWKIDHSNLKLLIFYRNTASFKV